MKFPAPVLLLSALPAARAWGGLGHQTVAFIASNFVHPETATYFQTLLGDDTPEYLAKVATWADSFRYTQAGRFTAPFHYIDSQDHPPESCGVAYSRDCGAQGCVVDAIQNYTSRLLDASLPFWERNMAAKFVIHFVGDIHQPLHDENLDKGGNGIPVLFDGRQTNLHSVWDTSIAEKLIGGYSRDLAMAWGFNLSVAIASGSYSELAETWLAGIDIDDPVSSSLIWAAEANEYICSTVMPAGPLALNGTELGGEYYERAVPVIELQVARAGYRLAAWLNLIVGYPAVQEL